MSEKASSGIYEILDDRFLIPANGDKRLELLFDGSRWTEGPVYLPAWRQVIFSDIPNDRMMRWDEATGSVGVFRAAAGNTNAHTLDREGRLITCEQGRRRITRTEHDGSITVLAERFQGKRFNGPNDAVVRSDGSIWFTDPVFGIISDYEGERGESEIGASNVYRLDPESGDLRIVAEGFGTPNGLSFTPDERQLFVSDTLAGEIRCYMVRGHKRLTDGRVFAQSPLEEAQFDGVKFDDEGRLWAAAGRSGLHCYDPDGTLIGRILFPTPVSNFTFGGPKNNRLFISSASSLYSLMVAVTGAPRVGGPAVAARKRVVREADISVARIRLRMNAGLPETEFTG
ncbi:MULTISPECIES: SMP-30/gluconolactonase/LRE family protein [Streptomyces]|uniref:SMP-30/gluconolactonase/LRE family protein n=1 Tax=Streptomyces TaxID=1883 RepID=UPI0003AAC24F|nr:MULTISPECIES: SMP-30/gluconolactonase/LRE family protein [Streptomyces]MBZ6082433.1 SMP-30/gluconolactonase/LRE family protein [Streptomyces olivaceus]MBZ6110127.1 SMP-30/gluconolactonase/LRE family protein [Streptomyces olivaceus]MBZ6124724.1 SMP-30/gluconolactonase/LRE family protein [Streptomyces olivaceus]MBZ6144832.1 SMP-30/gluconolactonase/LRE family protein [Streptomyces olivaceus]MBZ6159054.1 SMP-30/gluconolactonase/LRE family protein [Streptomyces olivaceus]